MMRQLTWVLLAMCAGCSTVGNESLANRAADWPPIDMTKAELVQELGEPSTQSLTDTEGKRTETLVWMYGHAESNPALYIPIVGAFVAMSGNGVTSEGRVLTVVYDHAGKMVSRSWSRTATGK